MGEKRGPDWPNFLATRREQGLGVLSHICRAAAAVGTGTTSD